MYYMYIYIYVCVYDDIGELGVLHVYICVCL